ncbi:hypothetical protein FACS1894204_08350 [Synergistales bacterium]|nr:hypothetical protein FACS1894204_08350 [Synergistales bacterium]
MRHAIKDLPIEDTPPVGCADIPLREGDEKLVITQASRNAKPLAPLLDKQTTGEGRAVSVA